MYKREDIQIIVLPDPRGRLFPDDLNPREVMFDPQTTPILHWVDDHPVHGPGWELLFIVDDDYGVGSCFIRGRLEDIDQVLDLARRHLRDQAE